MKKLSNIQELLLEEFCKVLLPEIKTYRKIELLQNNDILVVKIDGSILPFPPLTLGVVLFVLAQKGLRMLEGEFDKNGFFGWIFYDEENGKDINLEWKFFDKNRWGGQGEYDLFHQSEEMQIGILNLLKK